MALNFLTSRPLTVVVTYATNADMTNTSEITKFRKQRNMTLEEFGGLFEPRAHKSTVLRWEQRGVSAERAVAIETKVGIPRHLLRPDIFEAKAKRKAGAQ